ncbi:trafficking protein particle complex subunit 9-like, partial [Notothenia coriiceps]|uniref:Trafficking protein particle complex subunit 9-like n=1 Tax=Notothenia coriiceps TaxID=8208 RepID=A0A6I9PN69_9TELE
MCKLKYQATEFQWVQGDVCEVQLMVYNPMPYELRVENMSGTSLALDRLPPLSLGGGSSVTQSVTTLERRPSVTSVGLWSAHTPQPTSKEELSSTVSVQLFNGEMQPLTITLENIGSEDIETLELTSKTTTTKEKVFGEFLSWDLDEALSHLPLKCGQALTLTVRIKVKLDFSGQESLLQDLNDGECTHTGFIK